MFRQILVPLDGTPFAEQAVPTAIMLARAGRGRLLLARVFEPPPMALSDTGVPFTDAATIDAMFAAARDELDAEASRVAEHAQVPVQSALVTGDVATALHTLAVERGVDLVVIASHDRGSLGRLFLGSVAERVAREPGIPVLLVRKSSAQVGAERDADPSADVMRRPVEPFAHLLIPLDGSPVADAALGPAARLAHATGAAVTLVTVHDSWRHAAGVPDHAASGQYLDAVAGRLRADGLTVDVREVEDKDAARAIVRCAADVGADVIAMGTHTRGPLVRLVEGSVAEGVVHAVLLPVLLYNSGREAPRDEGPVMLVPPT
jgi:nucleotide-binding universal stress UspA family protein